MLFVRSPTRGALGFSWNSSRFLVSVARRPMFCEVTTPVQTFFTNPVFFAGLAVSSPPRFPRTTRKRSTLFQIDRNRTSTRL